MWLNKPRLFNKHWNAVLNVCWNSPRESVHVLTSRAQRRCTTERNNGQAQNTTPVSYAQVYTQCTYNIHEHSTCSTTWTKSLRTLNTTDNADILTQYTSGMQPFHTTADHDGGSRSLDKEVLSPEFVPDNICSSELALLADSCCRLANSAASRRIRSCWYCNSLWRSSCKRYSCSCYIHSSVILA